jgi:hypothetical protein
MAKVRVVTAIVPIEGHPRPAAEYSELGKGLRAIRAPIKAFYNTVEDCWLYKSLQQAGVYALTHSMGDNPAKNSLAYHIVQHNKPTWLGAASMADTQAEVFVWIDYGILHVPGVTPDVINTFLEQVKEDDFAIPGCWDRDRPSDDYSPSWRFCGGVMVVPRKYLRRFSNEYMDRTMRNINLKRNVTWEVNDLARLEKYSDLPIRWYKADHNETMFTNYARAP